MCVCVCAHACAVGTSRCVRMQADGLACFVLQQLIQRSAIDRDKLELDLFRALLRDGSLAEEARETREARSKNGSVL